MAIRITKTGRMSTKAISLYEGRVIRIYLLQRLADAKKAVEQAQRAVAAFPEDRASKGTLVHWQRVVSALAWTIPTAPHAGTLADEEGGLPSGDHS